MEQGYVKLYRSSMKDPLYLSETFTKWHAWCDLIMLAYYAPVEFLKRGIKVKAKRGCVYMGTLELAERWKWSRGKVNRFLNFLSNDKRISIHKDNVVSCITILNYEKFQQNEKSNMASRKKEKVDNDKTPSDLTTNDIKEDVLRQILSQMQELKERLDAQEKPKRKTTKKEPNPLITKGREIFESRYANLYSDSYYWQAKDSVAMDSLTKKIIYSRQQKGMSVETKDVMKALELFLSSVQDEWILKNYSVTNINSKYNEIVAQARANMNNGKQDRSNGRDKRRGTEATATRPEDYEGKF